jgi:CDP-4-dehydro-6-deoxyglucose reductase
VEGPKGTFFLRNSDCKNVILLATGTGIAPVKAILESMDANPIKFEDKSVYVFCGGRYFKELFWTHSFDNLNLSYNAVLSRERSIFAEFGYVQDVLLSKNIELSDSVVYACGSNDMIHEAKYKLIANGLPEFNFYSDAFVKSN